MTTMRPAMAWVFRFGRARVVQLGLLGLIGLVCVVVLNACQVSTPRAIAAGATLRIVIVPNYPPFTFKTADGELQGFEIDLIEAFAAATQTQIEYVPMPFFDDAIRELHGTTVDAAVAAITITPAREQIVSFSRPYFQSGSVIAVRESTTDLTSLDSLEGKRIGVETGTIHANLARTIADARVIGYDTTRIAWKELLHGKVDAVISGETATNYAIKNGSVRGMKLAGTPFNEEFIGIATPLASPNLDFVNQGLTTLIDQGTYAEIYQRWFDDTPPTLPARGA